MNKYTHKYINNSGPCDIGRDAVGLSVQEQLVGQELGLACPHPQGSRSCQHTPA
jgi:hypothetical protein